MGFGCLIHPLPSQPVSLFIWFPPSHYLTSALGAFIFLGAYHPWKRNALNFVHQNWSASEFGVSSCYLTCHSQLIPFSQPPIFSPLLSAGLWNLSCLFSAPASLRFHVDGGRLHTVALSLGKVQNQQETIFVPHHCPWTPAAEPSITWQMAFHRNEILLQITS